MKKIIVSMHTSLDGFVAGPNGEMDWINFDEEMFDLIGKITQRADTALYGRVTYKMMDAYWPTAGCQLNASKHELEHSRWYNQSLKVVVSTTIDKVGLEKIRIISDNIIENIKELKQQSGHNILMFGSPTTTHFLFNAGLIDELWLFINPVVLGKGIPLFAGVDKTKKLSLKLCKHFSCGVIAAHYIKKTTRKLNKPLEK